MDLLTCKSYIFIRMKCTESNSLTPKIMESGAISLAEAMALHINDGHHTCFTLN